MAEEEKKKKKEKEEKKVVLERAYVVPLRKEWLKAPRWRRAKKAVKALQEFAVKHMKADSVKLGKYVNLEIWKHGIQNPPHKVKVNCSKDDKGTVTVELVGAPVEKKEEKKKEGKSLTKKSKADIKGAMDELKEKTEEAIKKKEVEAKPEEKKEETKEEKPKEAPKKEEVKPSEKKPEVKEAPKEPAK